MRVLDYSPEGATKDTYTCFLPFDSISSSAILLVHQCCLLYTIKKYAYKSGQSLVFLLSNSIFCDFSWTCRWEYLSLYLSVLPCTYVYLLSLFSCAVVSQCFYFEIDSYKGLNKGHGCIRSAGQRRLAETDCQQTQRADNLTPLLSVCVFREKYFSLLQWLQNEMHYNMDIKKREWK